MRRKTSAKMGVHMRAKFKALMKRAVAVVLAMVVAFAGVSALGSAGTARAAGSEGTPSVDDLDVKVVITSSTVGEDYEVGSSLRYKITVTNTGEWPINNIAINDLLCFETLSIEKLLPGENKEFNISYVVTQADLDVGVSSLISQIGSKGLLEVKSDPYISKLSVSLTVTSTPANGEFYVLGEMITFKITVVNNGNVPKTGITVAIKRPAYPGANLVLSRAKAMIASVTGLSRRKTLRQARSLTSRLALR